MPEFLARVSEGNKQAGSQKLEEHLSNTAFLAERFSRYKNVARLAGILHDLGKATADFQEYLADNRPRGSVVHSIQGAIYLDELTMDAGDAGHLLREIVTLAVAAHHGTLYDGISPDGERIFAHRLSDRDNPKYHYKEALGNAAGYSQLYGGIDGLIDAAKHEVIRVMAEIEKAYSSLNSRLFALGLFVKYIYSCLIDADRYDAYLFGVNEAHTGTDEMNWDSLINAFERGISELKGTGKIAEIRRFISEQCREASSNKTGIYQLSVPTGSGKTLSSLRFALHHCKKQGKKRIIYVIPYLSIIEQTADELRKILGLDEKSEVLLEHHSGILPPDDDKELELQKLYASRWRNPIIITTMVQFLETVVSAKGSNLRKFHNMADSVIIFDEIQSIPIKTIHLFNETISYLSKMCNTTVLLCTATQPLLDKTERKNLPLSKDSELIESGAVSADLKRTAIIAENGRDTNDFACFVAEKAAENGNCLAVVNTKKAAKEIFEIVKKSVMATEGGFTVYHLSTSMCPVHRTEVLNSIKEGLKAKERIVCVTTQLIEAGVDISFSCVVRAMAGLDSVLQAAGRCNRHGESETPKNVYVMELKGENIDRLEDIKAGKEVTKRLIAEHGDSDLSEKRIMEQFYRYYFYDRRKLFDYPVTGGNTVYDMLSANNTGKGNYRNRTDTDFRSYIAHAFQSADDAFYVIGNNTEQMIAEYGEAKDLVKEYGSIPPSVITKRKIEILKKLEKYSVSLYPHEVKALAEAGAVYFIDKDAGVRLINERYYSKDTGVVYDSDPEKYMI